MGKKKNVENETTQGVVAFSDVYKGSLDSHGRLTDYLNEEMIIKDVEFTELGNYGDVAIATVEVKNVERRLHTFSQVLIKQLKAIEDVLKEGKVVKARLVKRKRYYTFE